jgi:hypothetical protein
MFMRIVGKMGGVLGENEKNFFSKGPKFLLQLLQFAKNRL